uniref:Uncharacterized protein n=1 Tax=Ascaris lumbricoides TaxID=6252 RepID=A0A0M3ISE0_ASCLU
MFLRKTALEIGYFQFISLALLMCRNVRFFIWQQVPKRFFLLLFLFSIRS